METGSEAELLSVFEQLALKAGAAILSIYETDFSVAAKSDDSPVTEADRLAEEIILEGLRASLPDIPCVAEEEASAGLAPEAVADTFILVDPLDGTREFAARNPDFTVNIALVVKGVPVAGVVYAPARDLLYAGEGGEAWRIDRASDQVANTRARIATREASGEFVIVSSRSHRTPETDAFIAQYDRARIIYAGSSLKFCMIAEGAADLYARFGRTMQWDTAAGDAVLRAAGGVTNTIDGTPLTYAMTAPTGLPRFANPWFISAGRLDA